MRVHVLTDLAKSIGFSQVKCTQGGVIRRKKIPKASVKARSRKKT